MDLSRTEYLRRNRIISRPKLTAAIDATLAPIYAAMAAKMSEAVKK